MSLPRNRPKSRLWLIAALALLAALVVQPALARTAVVVKQVIQDNDPGIDGLTGPLANLISPSGGHVLVTGYTSNSLVVFERDSTTGLLTFVDAVFNGEDDGHGNTVGGLLHPDGLAMSPDGNHVYVASFENESVAMFAFNGGSTAPLTFLGTITSGDTGTNKFDAIFLAVSPDGNHVYVVCQDNQSVSAFSRSSGSGLLSHVQTLKNGDSSGGGSVAGLDGAIDVNVSPDGKHVYVASIRDDSVVIFSRNAASGELTFVRAIADGSTDAGSGETIDGLNGAIAIAISPNGQRLYVVAREADALTVFNRSSTSGDLLLAQTLFDGGSDGSGGAVNGLNGAQQVAVSPDNTSVYVSARSDNALSIFTSVSNGLIFEEALIDGQPDGSGTTVDGLGSAIAVSGDNKYVYTLGFTDNALTVFSKESPDTGVSPSVLDFGSVPPNTTTGPKTVTLTNTGLIPLAITDISVGRDDYEVTHACPDQLAASAACTIDLTFTPSGTGSRNSSLVIETDAPDSPATVSLIGSGRSEEDDEPPPVNDDVTLDGAVFPASVAPGETISWTFTITNIGSGSTVGLVFHAPTDSRLDNLGGTASQGSVDVYPNELAWNVGNVPEDGTASVSLETRLSTRPPTGSENPGQVCILGTVSDVGKLLCVNVISAPAAPPPATPAAPAATTAAQAGPAPSPNLSDGTYVVRPGDTLFSIARRYGTTVADLVRLNGLADASRITPGQVIRLRETPTPAPPPTTEAAPTATDEPAEVSVPTEPPATQPPAPSPTLPVFDLPIAEAASGPSFLSYAVGACLFGLGLVLLVVMAVVLVRRRRT